MENNKSNITVNNEPNVVFKSLTDLRVLSVKDKDTKETIMEISGYDLHITFNRSKLNSVEDVEDMLDGLKDVFRQAVMQDLLEG